MRPFPLRALQRSLAWALGIFFAFQVVAVVPLHNFHGVERVLQARAAGEAARHESGSSLPEDCRCDFCLAYVALDSATARPPTLPAPVLAASSLPAPNRPVPFASPRSHALARGPPRRGA